MDALINALMAVGLLLILVLVIYLIDRVNSIEKETRKVAQSLGETAKRNTAPFAGLSGKKLWDAMTGQPSPSLDADLLTELRRQYEVVLPKHVEALFQEGYKDGQRGLSGDPKNTRMIATAQGAVESWIPFAQANMLYRCGFDASQLRSEALGPTRLALDEVGQLLYGKVQLPEASRLSDWLMPFPSISAAETAPTPTAG